MTDKISVGQEWFGRLLPKGLPVPSSTISSGPGGSGKPLIGATILISWLRYGKSSLIFLIYSDRTFAERLKELADNLMYSSMGKKTNLLFIIARIKGIQFEKEEVKVPITKKTLENLKEETNRFRKRIIPVISKI